MNKKGQIELAELGGFVLIFIAVIIFGYIFTNLSPKAHIELLESEHANYLARRELINYLSYEENGKNVADMIALAVKNNNFEMVEEKKNELLDKVVITSGEVKREIKRRIIEKFVCMETEKLRNRHSINLHTFEDKTIKVELIRCKYLYGP